MNLALFDFDNTIASCDTWTRFMRLAVRPSRLVAGRALLIPVVVGYRLGLVSASNGRQIAMRIGLQGEKAARVRELGIEYATMVLPTLLQPPALERIDGHKAQGDRIVVVSASLDMYLNPWCKTMGVDVICSQLEEKAGRLTGRYVRGDCTGTEKVNRIRERYNLTQYERIYAYGDSDEDREMLDLAHEKYYRWKKA